MLNVPKIKQAQHLDIPLASNHNVTTPLRYPGGKTVLVDFVTGIIDMLGMSNLTYVEPYAGGAGIALRLLKNGVVSDIVINDYDENVYAFWDSVVNQSSAFLKKFDEVEPTLDEWKRQRQIIHNPASELDRGFAFFFLNRTNRSGVINGGVIGGLEQSGRYKVSARYNKYSLREKLAFLGEYSSRIMVCCLDGQKIAEKYVSQPHTFTYLDPPYVMKGSSLYLNALSEQQHRSLAETLIHSTGKWMLTYDNAELVKALYKESYGGIFSLRYTAASHRQANELIAFSDELAEILRFKY